MYFLFLSFSLYTFPFCVCLGCLLFSETSHNRLLEFIMALIIRKIMK